MNALPLLALLLAQSSQDAAPAPPGTQEERAVAARVSAQRAAATVRELVACGPRMGGTKSGLRAASLRRRLFESAGLEVAELAGEERWCHQENGWAVSAILSLDGEEAVLPLATAWPYGYSPSSSGRAELAAGEPVAAAALLAVRAPRGGGDRPRPSCVLVDGSTTLDGAFPVVHHLPPGNENEFPVFGVSRGEGAMLRELLAEGRALELQWTLTAEISRGRPITTIATLPARAGAPPGYFLVCAHGDSDAGGPGANDNGSGESVVVEIASAWAAAVAAGEAPAPAREVRFAIWGSEIHSTRHYAEAAMLESAPILGVLNYDQAGFGSGADQLNVEPDDVPGNAGLVGSFAGVLREFAGAEFAGERGFPERWATNKSLGGTDSYVFSDSAHFRQNALPAVTLFISAWGEPASHPRTPGMPGESWRESDEVYVDYDNYYHSAGDLPQYTTDREPYGMAWCARVGALGLMRYLASLE